MPENGNYERLIAKLQHFAESIHHQQIEKEYLLLTSDSENCQKERMQEAIFVYENILKEYCTIFEEILYR